MKSLRIALWNANGLAQWRLETESFLRLQKIDVLLVAETHFTNKTFFNITGYSLYHTQHPDGTARGGSAILIRNGIQHYQYNSYQQDYAQITSIVVKELNSTLVLAAVYCPPRYAIKNDLFADCFQYLGKRFIAGGDYNAKHTLWGSRLITPRGRELKKAMDSLQLNHLSSGKPTYWPTDPNRIPDLLDFFVVKGISLHYAEVEESVDIASDHSPVILTISTNIIKKEKQPFLTNKQTCWDNFRMLIDNNINLETRLKTIKELEEIVDSLTKTIQNAAWNSTPTETLNTGGITSYPMVIKEKLAEKRRARRKWHNTRHPCDKTLYNRISGQLRSLLQNERNKSLQSFLQSLSASSDKNYSLWKVTKKIKQVKQHSPPVKNVTGQWTRSDTEKANIFAQHLADVFQPHPPDPKSKHEQQISEFLEHIPDDQQFIKPVSPKEVWHEIMALKGNKAPGHDLITANILKELPKKGLLLITYIFNAIFRLKHVPIQWKMAQIIMVLKPGKPANVVSSYRPISLMPVLSKVFEKLFMKRIMTIIDQQKSIPDHQFGFRTKHSTLDQVHRIVNKIENDFEEKRICSAVFLDISQAFDKVWHDGLLYKIKKILPYNMFKLISSYLNERFFKVKVQEEESKLYPIRAGVPQGSVLGPLFYIIYTADLPATNNTLTATFADDTAVLASDTSENVAARNLQNSLDQIYNWTKKWKISINENKSAHVIFTNRRTISAPVTINHKQIPILHETKYLGMRLDQRLTWKQHIIAKKKEINRLIASMYWLIGRNSTLTIDNKLLIYKAIIKPTWSYGAQLWGCAKTTNIKIIQRCQNKVLRIITNAPWFVRNDDLHRDLNVPTVIAEIRRYALRHEDRLHRHPNTEAIIILDNLYNARRLKRNKPYDII